VGKIAFMKNEICTESYCSWRQGVKEENDFYYKLATAPIFDTGGINQGFSRKWFCIV